jgi:hypothetical protein
MIPADTTHIVDGTLLIFITQEDLLVLKKIAPFAIGLLTVISIAPSSQAMTATAQPQSLQQPSRDLHAQIQIIIGGGHPEYHGGYRYRREAERRRYIEFERRRQEYYSRRHRYRDRYYSDDRYYSGDRYRNRDHHGH